MSNFKGWRSNTPKDKTDRDFPGFQREPDAARKFHNPILQPAPTAAKPKSSRELMKEKQRAQMQERVRARRYRLIIGIDPGRETGFAVWNKPSRTLLQVETFRMYQAQREILLLQELNGPEILVRVEDARLRTYLPKEKNESEYRGKLMGAGSVKRDCQLWEEFLDEIGVDYELLKPRAGMTKWSVELFQRLTEWQGVTSNHARDAAANVFGL